jgi:RNA polymerase sigma-70 factor (ECF subfamily)
MKELDDASLLMLITQAQIDAFGELYDRYSRLVFSVAYAMLGDKATAEEVTLDVFVHVWQRAKTYRPERAKVSTWLVAMTRNQAIDVLRWQKSRPDLTSLGWDDTTLQRESDSHSTQEQVELSIQRDKVRQALARLPENERQALALAYFQDYSHTQIAEVLQQPLGTIKTRIRTAMQKLRQMLEAD